MNYYTSTIPPTLAEKLKEKGMPIKIELEWYPNGMAKAEKDCHKPMTKYCEVFDWLLGAHEAFVYVTCLRMDDGWQYCGGIWGFSIDMTFVWRDTWHEAANAAIEKALELI